MKQLSPFLFCLTLCAGCLTKDYQYAVICDFPAEYGGPNWLVVTDDAGNILKTFDVPELTTHLDERFNLDVEDRLETYNLHLVKKGPFLNYSSVFSFYGVGNGAAVTFNPLLDYTGPAPDAYKILSVKELAAPAVVEVPGNFYEYPQTWRYDAAAQTASMSVAFLNTSDFVVRIRPAGSASFHSLYVITDTMNGFFIKRQWSDFLPETNFRLIELSGGGQADLLEVTAIRPDFKRFTTLMLYDGGTHQPALSPTQVALPPGLYPESYFRIRVHQGGHTAERTFRPGETLRIEENDLTIKSAALAAQHTMEIQVGGTPDLVETNIRMPDLAGNIRYWNIQGPPEACQHLVLPDLTGLIPGWILPEAANLHFEVTASRYGRLDYAQLVAGFPYKGSDGLLFPIARYGLQTVTKSY